MKNYTIILILIAILALVCTACPKVSPEEESDSRLIGVWSNKKDGNDAKTFKVEADFTFSCHINPGMNGSYEGAATVTGKLNLNSGDVYTMNDLSATPDAPSTTWTDPLLLAQFNSQRIRITFYDKDSFKFESAQNDAAVNMFFGGDYYRTTE